MAWPSWFFSLGSSLWVKNRLLTDSLQLQPAWQFKTLSTTQNISLYAELHRFRDPNLSPAHSRFIFNKTLDLSTTPSNTRIGLISAVYTKIPPTDPPQNLRLEYKNVILSTPKCRNRSPSNIFSPEPWSSFQSCFSQFQWLMLPDPSVVVVIMKIWSGHRWCWTQQTRCRTKSLPRQRLSHAYRGRLSTTPKIMDIDIMIRHLNQVCWIDCLFCFVHETFPCSLSLFLSPGTSNSAPSRPYSTFHDNTPTLRWFNQAKRLYGLWTPQREAVSV